MKKPIKNIYLIEASNGRVYVRYINSDYYETNKGLTKSWNIVEDQYAKVRTYRNFETGEKAEEYIISKKELYEKDLEVYNTTMASINTKKQADNDNLAQMIRDEAEWRTANMDGKIFK